jgi:IS30 family transposase
MLVRIPYDRTAERVAELLVGRKMETLSEFLCNSVTWDQGKEMAKPPTSPFEPRCPFTSPDPHSPWQRGSNENTNGLLRPYFPKGTDLSLHSQEVTGQVLRSPCCDRALDDHGAVDRRGGPGDSCQDARVAVFVDS